MKSGENKTTKKIISTIRNYRKTRKEQKKLTQKDITRLKKERITEDELSIS